MQSQTKINLVPHVVLATVVFIVFSIIGTRLPAEVQNELVAQMQLSTAPLASMGPAALVILIFLNNALKCFLIIALGVLLGLPSVLFLCFNAISVGTLVSYTSSKMGLSVIFAALAPHGIIEIPLMLFSVALGLSIGAEALKSIMKQKNALKAQFIYSLNLYGKWMLALFLVAALIEVFLTPYVVSLAGGSTGLLLP